MIDWSNQISNLAKGKAQLTIAQLLGCVFPTIKFNFFEWAHLNPFSTFLECTYLEVNQLHDGYK